jgi:hypothetical protein
MDIDIPCIAIKFFRPEAKRLSDVFSTVENEKMTKSLRPER